MDWLTLLNVIILILSDESKHFLLALFSGLLGYCLTSIMLFAPYWVYLRLTRKVEVSAVVYFMLFIATLAGICFAVQSHIYLDGLSTWLTKPLGPGLNIIQ